MVSRLYLSYLSILSIEAVFFSEGGGVQNEDTQANDFFHCGCCFTCFIKTFPNSISEIRYEGCDVVKKSSTGANAAHYTFAVMSTFS